MLLRFGAVHTCRVVPVPSPEVLRCMDAQRIADQEEARKTARALVGHHVNAGHSLHDVALIVSLVCWWSTIFQHSGGTLALPPFQSC